jgi:hypothetical protein
MATKQPFFFHSGFFSMYLKPVRKKSAYMPGKREEGGGRKVGKQEKRKRRRGGGTGIQGVKGGRSGSYNFASGLS